MTKQPKKNTKKAEKAHKEALAKTEAEAKHKGLLKAVVIKVAGNLIATWQKTDERLVQFYLDGFKNFANVDKVPITRARKDNKIINAYHKALKPYLVIRKGWSDGYARKRLSMLREKAGLRKQIVKAGKKSKKANSISLNLNSKSTVIRFDSGTFETDLFVAFKKMLESDIGEAMIKAYDMAREEVA